jgi:hypothetical protein
MRARHCSVSATGVDDTSCISAFPFGLVHETHQKSKASRDDRSHTNLIYAEVDEIMQCNIMVGDAAMGICV